MLSREARILVNGLDLRFVDLLAPPSVFSFHDTSEIEDSSRTSLFWSSRHTRDTVCFESVFDV